MGFGEKISALAQGNQQSLSAAIALLLALAISTRFLTTLFGSSSEEKKGASPPKVPYWIPFIGDLPTFSWSPGSYLASVAKSYPQGLFEVKLGRKKKVFIHSQALVDELLKDANKGKLDGSQARQELFQNAFSYSHKSHKAIVSFLPGHAAASSLVTADVVEQLKADAIKQLERQLPDVISFSNSKIDQHQWERASNTVLLDDKETTETGLISLIQTFLTHFTTQQLLSPALLEQTPDLALVLQSFQAELDGLLHRSRLLTPKGSSIINTLMTHTTPFMDAVYASEAEQERMMLYEDVPTHKSPFLSVLQSDALRAAPGAVQSSVAVYLLALSIIPHIIVPWAIIQLNTHFSGKRQKYASNVRDEVHQKVAAVQEPGIGAFHPPPSLTINPKVAEAEALNGLLAETTREYARGWTERQVTEDITLTDPNDGSQWYLKKGSLVVAAHWLETSAPSNETPERFRDTLRHLGDFHHPSLADYLETVYTAFIAGFLKLYTIEPVDSNGWKIPTAKFAVGTALPRQDVRVRIRTRDYDADGELRIVDHNGGEDESEAEDDDSGYEEN